MKMTEEQRINAAIGQKIRECRESLGMRQEALGTLVGVEHQQVSKYERGVSAMTTPRLVAIADALGVSVMALLAGVSGTHEKEHRLLARFRSLPTRSRARFMRHVDGFVDGEAG